MGGGRDGRRERWEEREMENVVDPQIFIPVGGEDTGQHFGFVAYRIETICTNKLTPVDSTCIRL